MSAASEQRPSSRVLDVRVDACTYESVTDTVDRWVRERESRYVCIANVHVVTSAAHDPRYARVLEHADLVTPDGAPIAWAMRRLGRPAQRRVDGPGWMLHWCEHAARHRIPIFLYGSTEETLALLRTRLLAQFPGLQVAGTFSPPFRPLEPHEREHVVRRIRRSGAGVVFVGLGAPRQELWMSEMRSRLPAVLVGIGAAFDFHAGTVTRAPAWMRRAGLEWVHRLMSEPRRLWRRYLVSNSRFVVGFGAQLVRDRTRRA